MNIQNIRLIGIFVAVAALLFVVIVILNRVFDVHTVRLIDNGNLAPGKITPAILNRPTVDQAALAQ